MLDLDVRHLDAPVVGSLVQDALYISVELVAFRKHVIEFVLAEHGSQRRLRELAGSFEHVRYANNRLLGIDDSKVDDRVYLDGNVIPRDDVLRGHVEDDHPQVHFRHRLDYWEQQDQAGPLDTLETPEEKHDTTLVLLQHLDGVVKQDHDDRDNQSEYWQFHGISLVQVAQVWVSSGVGFCCGKGST